MVQALIQQLMRDQHLPGLALGIRQGDTMLVEEYAGLANVEHSIPVNPETVFEIASVTKLFTAQAILLLMQDKRLTLADRLQTYIPDLPDAWADVTIKHCLTHQSGITGYTDVPQYWERTHIDKTHAEVLALVRDLPLKFASGARYNYDNTGFYLLGMVIEQISGMSYGAFLHERIFKPLNMTSTRANDYAQIIPHRAQGYIYRDEVLVNKPFYSLSNTFSAGVVLSTIRDLSTWQTALFDDRILNADSRALWWTPNPSEAGNERAGNFTLGLGWFILDSPLGQFMGHNGGIAGFASSLMYFPKTDITALVLCNASHIHEPHAIAFEVIKALMPE